MIQWPRARRVIVSVDVLPRTCRAEHVMSMPSPIAHDDWTVDMLDALPDDGQRYELIDGELFVTAAPTDVHQLVATAFHRRLHDYLRPTSLGRAMISPADVRKEPRTRNRVQPDVFAVRLTGAGRPPYPFDLSDVLLAIEVESPSNPLLDYQIKRELNLKHGIPEYWIVNTDALVVSRWRSPNDPGEVYSRTIAWAPAGMPEPLVIDIPALFEDALG